MKEPSLTTNNLPSWKGRDVKLLLADDNPTNIIVVKAMLSKYHIEATVVPDGQSALTHASEEKWDLIILDCMMPEISGYDVAREIRKRPKAPNYETPIIAFTANTLPGDREDCINAGMNDYLPKPIRPKVLEEILTKYLHTKNESAADISDTNQTDPGEPSGNVFNKAAMQELFDGDTDMIASLMEAFETGIDEQIGRITKAIEEGTNAEELRLHTHNLKGSAANYGAERLENQAQRMETACRDGDLDKAISMYPKLKEEELSLKNTLKTIDWTTPSNNSDPQS